MGIFTNYLPCDGCGLPAAPEHIAERVKRLEFSTRFRPIHIGVLFVALAPSQHPENDFYGPPESGEFFDPFLEALSIPANSEKSARLAEFQRRGYYLAYISECPLGANQEPAAATIARLGPTLVRRIRFNYRPKDIAPLGQDLLPLVEVLRTGGVGPVLTIDKGSPLSIPRTGDREGMDLFQRAVASIAPRENLSSGYDRIQLTSPGRDLGAGGNT
jgi:hypothetical protein